MYVRLYKSCVRSVMSYGSECWAMKKVDTRRMQAAEMRMMCGKTLRDAIPNGLLRDRIRSGRYREPYGRYQTEMAWGPWKNRWTNLIKRVREERFPGHMKRGRPKKSWNEMVKEDMKKRGLCINDVQDRNKWRDATEEWSNPVNSEEDRLIKAERRSI